MLSGGTLFMENALKNAYPVHEKRYSIHERRFPGLLYSQKKHCPGVASLFMKCAFREYGVGVIPGKENAPNINTPGRTVASILVNLNLYGIP